MDITGTFSYDFLRNLEETGQDVPDGVPGPQGFLEPFHFHLGYVVPEPALLAPGAVFLMRRKIRSRRGPHGE